MKKLLAILVLLCSAFPAYGAFFDRDDCDQIPAAQRVTNGTMCLQRTTAGGRTAGQTYVWNGATWEAAASVSEIVGGLTFTGEARPAQIVATANNYTGCDVANTTVCYISTDALRSITGIAGASAGQYLVLFAIDNGFILENNDAGSDEANQFAFSADISVGANQGIILQYDGTATNWRAASGISGGGAGQAADDDLTAIAALACTGLVARTAANTFTCRSITTAGGLTITNPAGVAGNIQIDPDATVWRTTGGTASGGNHNYAAATSLTAPTAAGAAPTSDGRLAFDSTAKKYKGSENSTAVTFATEELLAAWDHDSLNNRSVDSSGHPIYILWEGFAGTPPALSCDRVNGGQLQFDFSGGGARVYVCPEGVGGNPIDIASQNIAVQGAATGTYTATSTGADTVQLGRAAGLANEWRVWSAKNGSGTTAFTNNTLGGDAIELISDNAGDVQACTVHGTTNGGDQSNVIMETVTMNGVGVVTTAKADWGKSYVIDCASVAVGTITIREASGNVTIATIAPGQTYAANAQTWLVKASPSLTKQIYIPAGAMSISGACTDTEPTERTPVASGPKRYTIAPADDGSCSIEFDFATPTNWDAGTVTVKLIALSTTNQNTEVFAMDFGGQAVSDGDQVAAHVDPTAANKEATLTFGNQTNDLQMATTSAITIAGTPTAGDMVFMIGQVDTTATTYAPTAVWTELNILGVVVTITLL